LSNKSKQNTQKAGVFEIVLSNAQC